ncbi:hypothetical protein PCL_06093 [Purpureocillium lilacinum]|uniref:Uncharacterized protein n=1 Tax=Purpureocillium lilacinum TaxID=33203 RepID=A0A2U3ELQ9_PURLI|nr:hypothetical protein PCL_06093 [Purpureocillium lilacinum]
MSASGADARKSSSSSSTITPGEVATRGCRLGPIGSLPRSRDDHDNGCPRGWEFLFSAACSVGRTPSFVIPASRPGRRRRDSDGQGGKEATHEVPRRGGGARVCGAAAVRGDASVSLERVTNDVNSSGADQTTPPPFPPRGSVSLWDADPDADNLTQVYVQEDDRLALGGAGSTKRVVLMPDEQLVLLQFQPWTTTLNHAAGLTHGKGSDAGYVGVSGCAVQQTTHCRGRAVEPFRKLAGAHDDARPPGPCLTGSTTVPYDGALGFFKSATTARSLRGSCWPAAQLGDSAGERIPTGIQGREKPGPEKGTPPLRTGDNSQAQASLGPKRSDADGLVAARAVQPVERGVLDADEVQPGKRLTASPKSFKYIVTGARDRADNSRDGALNVQHASCDGRERRGQQNARSRTARLQPNPWMVGVTGLPGREAGMGALRSPRGCLLLLFAPARPWRGPRDQGGAGFGWRRVTLSDSTFEGDPRLAGPVLLLLANSMYSTVHARNQTDRGGSESLGSLGFSSLLIAMPQPSSTWPPEHMLRLQPQAGFEPSNRRATASANPPDWVLAEPSCGCGVWGASSAGRVHDRPGKPGTTSS